MTSVVIATKDLIKDGRGIKRLVFQVYSLRNQADEVIIVDGSGHAEHQQIAQRIKTARIFHVTQAKMNLSALWNIGVEKAQGSHILISGADMVYHSRFLEFAKEKYKEDTLLMCQAHTIPKTDPITYEKIDLWAWRGVKPFPHGKLANGIQFASKEVFKEVPYDERMELLGGMDNLMEYKCAKSGIEPVWWEQNYVYHQWHQQSRYKQHEQFEKNQQTIREYLKDG